jgi:hypothetical protein
MYLCGNNWVEWDLRLHRVQIHALTDGTSLYILDHETLHVRPPVVMHHTSIGVKDSRVPCTLMVMIHVENALLQWQVIGHYWSGPLKPMMIYRRQSMVFRPLLDLHSPLFLLIVYLLFDI